MMREIGPVIASAELRKASSWRHALADVAAVEALDDAVDGAEEDAALAVDVGLELGLQRRLEGVGRADGHRPAEGDVGRAAVDVLLDGEAAVDAGAVDFLALHVEAAHGRAHALGADADDVDVGREAGADVLHVAEEEAVGEAEGRAGLEVLEDFLEELSLGGVGDQEQDEVGLAHDVEHLAEGAVGLGEAGVAAPRAPSASRGAGRP